MEDKHEIMVAESSAPLSNSFNMVNVEEAKAFMENYQQVVEALLDSSDYQKMGKARFKKKSAWRKLATAFNISDDIIKEEIVRDDDYGIISAKYYVQATLPNGRSGVGVGVCSIFDKITKKDAEKPSNFVLRNRFNNAEHDVPSTAHTRAKNRAIADLIGAGEVSADELNESAGETKVRPKPRVAAPKKPSAKPKKTDEVIEVEVVADKPALTIKDKMEKDNAIKMAVKELQEDNKVVNNNTVKALLLEKMEKGALSKEAYVKAKEIMG